MKHLASLFSFLNPKASWLRRLLHLACVLALVVVLFKMSSSVSELVMGTDLIPEALATNGTENSTAQNLVEGASGTVGRVMSLAATLIFKLMAGIVWFVLYWMGDLMDNTFILEGEIGEKIRSVWVIVRNFVNIFFALALVVVALMSVVGYDDEGGNYSMKKFIPKMALALIAVNFTFLACRIVLDINNVLTTAVFAIPQSVTTLGDVGPTGSAQTQMFRKYKCYDSQEELRAAQGRLTQLRAQFPNALTDLSGVCFAVGADGESAPTSADLVPLNSTRFTKKDFTFAMATQFQGLHNLNKVSALTEKSFANLTVNALFSVVFAAIYGTAYIAMFIILLARMVVIWITIMLSPLIAIKIALPEALPDDLDIQKKFIDHAFVPLKMAIPLSFGYILISQMAATIHTSTVGIVPRTIDLTQGGELARGVDLTTMMYGAASAAIIWMGVFSASKGVISEGVTDTLFDKVKGIGTTIAKWPAYAPIIPTGSGRLSLAGLGRGVSTLRSGLAEQRLQRDRATFERAFGDIVPRTEVRDAITEIESMLRSRNINEGRLRTSLSTLATTDQARFREQLSEISNNLSGLDPAQRGRVLRTLGYSNDDTGIRNFNRDRVNNPDQIRTRLSSGGSSSTEGGGQANYDGTLSGSISGVDVTNWSSGARREFGFGENATGAQNLDLGRFGATRFINSFKSNNVGPGVRADIIGRRASYFSELGTDNSERARNFRSSAQGDGQFRRGSRIGYGCQSIQLRRETRYWHSIKGFGKMPRQYLVSARERQKVRAARTIPLHLRHAEPAK